MSTHRPSHHRHGFAALWLGSRPPLHLVSSLELSGPMRVTLVRRAQKKTLHEGLKPIERQSSLIPAGSALSHRNSFMNVAALLRSRRAVRINALIQSLALSPPRHRHAGDSARIGNGKLISLRAQGCCGFLNLPAAQAAKAKQDTRSNFSRSDRR